MTNGELAFLIGIIAIVVGLITGAVIEANFDLV